MKYFFILCASFLLLSCTPRKHDTTFRVSLRYIPQNVDIRGNQINTNVYILSHLYYPLFDLNAKGELTSYFLNLDDTKAMSNKFDEYKICLKEGVRFSNNENIQVTDLESSLREIHQIEESLVKIKDLIIDQSCINISLEIPDYNYLKKLTGISSTILKKGDKSPFPIGKGKYKVKGLTPDKLTLVAEDDTPVAFFKNIEFIKYKNINTSLRDKIDDWNHISRMEIPEEVKKQSQAILRSSLKTYAVVINYNDSNLRKHIIKCFNIPKFKEMLGLHLIPTEGFLPNGLIGSNVNYHALLNNLGKIDCSTKLDKTVKYYNFVPETREVAYEYFKISQKDFPVRVDYEDITGDQAVKLIFSGNEYMSLIGFDSSSSGEAVSGEPSVFFESFIRDQKKIINNPPANLKNLITMVTKTNEKEKLYTDAHRLLLESGYVIPLGQESKKQYYDKKLTNIFWQDQFSGYPQVDKLSY